MVENGERKLTPEELREEQRRREEEEKEQDEHDYSSNNSYRISETDSRYASSNDHDNNGLGAARRPANPSPISSTSSMQPSNSRSSGPLDSRSVKKPSKMRNRSSSNATHDDLTAVTEYTGSTTQITPRRPTAPNNSNQSRTSAIARSNRMQQRMYQRQIQLLASLSGGSIVAFLFFVLNTFAFMTLIFGVTSSGMLLYTTYSYFIHLLNSGDGALFQFLPASLQDYLENTTLHGTMTAESTFVQDNLWWLLYFIPGLTPEQTTSMVSRLPQRQRDQAFGPGGMARLLPADLFRLIAPPSSRQGGQNRSNGATRLTGESGHVMRITDGQNPEALPVIEELDDNENDDSEEDITMQDAFQGILNNARSLINGENNNAISTNVNNTFDETIGDQFNDMSWDDDIEDDLQDGRVEVHVVGDSDSETSDLGIDVSADDFTGGMNNSQLSRLGRMLRLRAPPEETSNISQNTQLVETPIRPPRTVTANTGGSIYSDLPNMNSRPDVDEPILEEEEEDIINEAISTAVNNISTNANNAISDAVANAAVSVVESVTPTLIRTGTRLTSFASVGLVGLFATSQMQPTTVLGRSIGGGGRRLGEQRSERYLITGLLSSMAVGAFSVGGSYLTRYLVRRQFASKRETLKNSTDRIDGRTSDS